jgi:hypothetical protein
LRESLAAFGRLAMSGLVMAAACSREKPPSAPESTLEVQWVGSDTGKLVAPVVAEWCDSLRLLELRATRGDTGIALALYPADSLSPGNYPTAPPERADSTRPSAAVAMRWFAETSIRGFRGDSGAVSVAATGPGVGAGRFAGRLRSTTEGSVLRVSGSFRGLTVRPAPPDCAGLAKSPVDSAPELEEEFRETAD